MTNKKRGADVRKRYKESFLRRYGIDFLNWVKWKKEHTPREINEKRLRANK